MHRHGNQAVPWESLRPDEAAERLGTDPQRGLDAAAVAERRQMYGYNELHERQTRTPLQMLSNQLAEFLVLILAAAGVISFLLGEIADAAVIFVVITVNAILGVVQEYRAEKSLAALKTLAAPRAQVLREGRVAEVPARDLVPGDVIFLATGDLVPADGRLLETANLQVNQSPLTGEAAGVAKQASFQAAAPLPLADRANLVHLGTTVTFGHGRAVVVATGMHTEIGRIAGLIQATPEEKTPLQQKLAGLGKQLGVLAVAACAAIFLLGIVQGNNFYPMFLVAVSLAVAAIPEGLPAIVTIVLAMGVQRMGRQKAIIRKLPAVETLGAVTVICSDKTGTLTQNAMTVRYIVVGERAYAVTGEGYSKEGEFLVAPSFPPHTQPAPRLGEAGANGSTGKTAGQLLKLLLSLACLSNDARLIREEGTPPRVAGDPTEGALVVAAEKAGLCPQILHEKLPRVHEYPFDAERKRSTTVHRGALTGELPVLEGSLWLFVKGAPELLLERCTRLLTGEGKVVALNSSARERIAEQNRTMASAALRVLAFALRPLEAGAALPGSPEEAEQDLVFVGLAGMMDPPRPEAARALEACRRAGIKVKMITGDHQVTALAVGRALGLASGEGEVLTGSDMDTMSREELKQRVEATAIFARVSPEHKEHIVDALKSRGEVVAMTGDGVNDAPALKKADIGVAMGITGTAVAREASEMILADDNFATIVSAVQEGRIIFDNIRKAIYFLLSCNLGEILIILAAVLLGWPLPLLPIQILWVNLVTDSLPALALGVDPPEGNTMLRPPRNPHEGIFAPGTKTTVGAFALFIACITLTAFGLGWPASPDKGRSMAFATLAFSQLAHVYNFRSLEGTVLNRGLLGNRPLLGGILLSGALQLAVFFTPFLAAAFRVERLERADWLTVALLALSVVLFGELWKAGRRLARTKKGGGEIEGGKAP